MLTTKAARRYATALLELAQERDELEEVLADIEFMHNTLNDSKELVRFLKSPIINYDDKTAVLNELFSKELEESTRLFVKLLARKDRINLLDQITESFIQQYKKHVGIITVDVYVASDLSEEQRQSLHQKLEEKTQKQVDMKVIIDESLKGGMAVRIDDTVIDGTVKHQLEQLEESLLATAVE